jgi:hypothetical protein
LGIYLSKTGSYLKAKQHIAQQATKAMFMLMKKIRVLNLSYDIQIELFNKTIRPILLYGSELWGFTNINILEKVQLKFMKQILYLKQSTPSYMIYGELGILPLREEAKIRMVSYWCRLTVNGINKLSNYLYSFIETLHKQRKIKSKWLEYIKAAILNNGFQNIWDNQNNFNNKWFQLAFKRRVKDSYLQTWNEQLNNSSSSITYKIIKHNFGINKYFTILPNYQCRILTTFRTRNHRLPIEVGRWHNIPINERTCFLCYSNIGDEYHYILECKHFEDLRKKHIKRYYYNHPNILKFNLLLNSDNKSELLNLCKFINIITKNVKAQYQ